MKFRHGLFVNFVYAEVMLDVIIQGIRPIHVGDHPIFAEILSYQAAVKNSKLLSPSFPGFPSFPSFGLHLHNWDAPSMLQV